MDHLLHALEAGILLVDEGFSELQEDGSKGRAAAFVMHGVAVLEGLKINMEEMIAAKRDAADSPKPVHEETLPDIGIQ